MGSRLVGILKGVGGYLFGARQSVTSSREKVGRKVGKPTLSTQVFDIIGCVAETVGFEPTIESPLYTLSRRAPSTTRPRLRIPLGDARP